MNNNYDVEKYIYSILFYSILFYKAIIESYNHKKHSFPYLRGQQPHGVNELLFGINLGKTRCNQERMIAGN